MSDIPLAVLPIMRQDLDPLPALARIRAEQPVVRLRIPAGPSAWLVTRYHDVRAVLADTDRFSNDLRNLAGVYDAVVSRWRTGGLGFSDPPRHTHLRRLLAPAFTARRLRRLRASIEAIVAERLDAMAAGGPPADLVSAFALPVASWVICEFVGVPEAGRGDFLSISNGRFTFSGDATTSVAAIDESLDRVAALVAGLRREPDDGLLGRLIHEHGHEFDDRELTGLADGLLTGGHDTTACMIALGALVLLENAEHIRLVRDVDDRLDRVVEELLRYVTVAQLAFPRFARRDTVVGGQRIRAGEMVFCSLSAANRDAALGTGMDAFDPVRDGRPHIAFGHGMHRCIGAPLARLELRVALPMLFRRFPTLRLATRLAEIEFRPLSIVYGVESLPVTW
jgi:cytochrome P450